MKTRFAYRLLLPAAAVGALFLAPASRGEDAAANADLAKQLSKLLAPADAKTEVTVKELVAQLRVLLASLEAQLNTAEPAEAAPVEAADGGEPAPKPQVNAEASVRPVLIKGGLQTASLQASAGLQSGARGRTPDAEWRVLFPKRTER